MQSKTLIPACLHVYFNEEKLYYFNQARKIY